jgi:hypothetical protein
MAALAVILGSAISGTLTFGTYGFLRDKRVGPWKAGLATGAVGGTVGLLASVIALQFTQAPTAGLVAQQVGGLVAQPVSGLFMSPPMGQLRARQKRGKWVVARGYRPYASAATPVYYR